MFVCVARVSLDIPGSGSLKAKRQVLRRISDRVKARYNVSIAEGDASELWQRAVMALALVGTEKQAVNEQMDKIIHFIEEMYVAPVTGRELEILSFGDQLFSAGDGSGEAFLELPFLQGERSLAEAEGMGAWEERHARPTAPSAPQGSSHPPRAAAAGAKKKEVPLEEARAKARSLRNKREWEP